ncbi:MAG: hypothetical protein ACK5RO_02600 [Pseudobdellovibrionaceae bacterium]|jgi:hypothetical protein
MKPVLPKGPGPLPKPFHNKWFLTLSLFVAVGFSLSLNPHNQQIHLAKHQFQVIELSSTEVAGQQHSIRVTSTKDQQVYEARVLVTKDMAVAQFARIQGAATSSGDCGLCGKIMPLELTEAQRNNTDAIKEIVAKLVEQETGKPAAPPVAQQAPAAKPVQKPGEATEVDLEEWAKKCEKASDSQLLSCHSRNLVELSRYLKNTRETDSLVREYFDEHLRSDLRSALNTRRVMVAGFGQVIDNSEAFEKANEITEQLMERLGSRNGKATRDALVRMQASRFSEQARHAQGMARQGMEESNPQMFALGNNLMTNLGYEFNYTSANMIQSLDAIRGLDSMGRADYATMMQNNFMSPVQTMLNQLFADRLKYQIPVLAGDGLAVPTVPVPGQTLPAPGTRGGRNSVEFQVQPGAPPAAPSQFVPRSLQFNNQWNNQAPNPAIPGNRGSTRG